MSEEHKTDGSDDPRAVAAATIFDVLDRIVRILQGAAQMLPGLAGYVPMVAALRADLDKARAVIYPPAPPPPAPEPANDDKTVEPEPQPAA